MKAQSWEHLQKRKSHGGGLRKQAHIVRMETRGSRYDITRPDTVAGYQAWLKIARLLLKREGGEITMRYIRI